MYPMLIYSLYPKLIYPSITSKIDIFNLASVVLPTSKR